MATPTILRKTRTAADYIHRHSSDRQMRHRAAAILRALADVHAATNSTRPTPAEAAPLQILVEAVAACAGHSWLNAHSDHPDIVGLTALNNPHLSRRDLTTLDDLLATVLWRRHGPLSPQ